MRETYAEIKISNADDKMKKIQDEIKLSNAGDNLHLELIEIVMSYLTIYKNYTELTKHRGAIRFLEQLPNGKIVSASDDRNIMIWNIYSGTCKMLIGHMREITSILILDTIIFHD